LKAAAIHVAVSISSGMCLEVPNVSTGTCGTACRCNICERRSGGKSVLKTRPNRTGSIHASDGQQNLPLGHLTQVPASIVSPGKASNSAGSWQAFVAGGAQADDARILQERMKQEAEFRESLIQERSPVKAQNQLPSLLEGLGLADYEIQYRPRGGTGATSKGKKAKGEQTPAFNLLD
jgi:hypothetical protein